MSDIDGKLARDVAFGHWFADQRSNLSRKYGRKVTQEEIADKIGIHPGSVSRIERGEQGAELSRFASIAKALEVPIEEVYAAYGIHPTPIKGPVDKIDFIGANSGDFIESITREDTSEQILQKLDALQRDIQRLEKKIDGK